MDIKEIVGKILLCELENEISTEKFLKLKHNSDLVPKFRKNLKYLTDICGHYSDDCYDIQGVADDGVDVLYKYKNNEDYSFHKIGVQIKSYDDIKAKDWLVKLKAQLLEQQGIWQTDDLYIALCTDSSTHKDKIRNGISEIQKITKQNVHILTPEESIRFYEMTQFDILQYVYFLLHKNDSLYKKAVQIVQNINNISLAALIDVIVEQFIERKEYYSVHDMFRSTLIDEYCENEQIGEWEIVVFDVLNDENFIHRIDEYGDAIEYIYDNHWPLTNFVVEIKSRYDLDRETLKKFMFKQLCRK
ncbi:hypothetical protein [uncultured Fibrobacter sp.]|uniref:hypothetical protein n=1 Tax=uncultured Fibrobacter sp. TaxID=261512 RepID=UPI0025D54A45|nr:hypothetical protein [uncultured Fibrobacter sp.]